VRGGSTLLATIGALSAVAAWTAVIARADAARAAAAWPGGTRPALQASANEPPSGPVLPLRAATLASFVPAGWSLEEQQTADLNSDGRSDAVLLLKQQVTMTAPPRILLVALQQRGGQYALAEQNRRLIPQVASDTLEDPMGNGEILARQGGFDITLTQLAGAGSYQTATFTYRFRRLGGCFRLVGYDRLETHRATLDTRDLSVDFLTAVVVQRTGNERSEKTEERKSTLNSNPRRCLADLGSAADFNPL
jgi:hypothetical protein